MNRDLSEQVKNLMVGDIPTNKTSSNENFQNSGLCQNNINVLKMFLVLRVFKIVSDFIIDSRQYKRFIVSVPIDKQCNSS